MSDDVRAPQTAPRVTVLMTVFNGERHLREAIDSVLGLNISRSFALNAIAAVVIAEAVILGLRYRALLLPAAAVGVGFAVATLVAYFLSRTRGLLGFEETSTTTEAVIAMVAEAVALVALVPVAVTEARARRHPAR